MSLDREPIEHNVLTVLQAMTIAAGYELPRDLRLVTRQIMDYDETNGQRPAAIIQFTEMPSELVGIGGISQATLSGRIVFYFDPDTGSDLPATWANRYVRGAIDALEADRSRGANPYVLTTRVVNQPTALIWKLGQACEATLFFEVLLMYD